MRRFASVVALLGRRHLHLPWASRLPPVSDPRWSGIGQAVVETALRCDTGEAAFHECCVAREQLETIVQSMGYDMNIYIFGGLVTMGFFEAGGDVDFVGVSDIEPGFEEAGEIVSRCSRELRRLGLRTWALPKARVPVLKADRTSKSLPGSPIHNLACDGIFQMSRQASFTESESFNKRLLENYGALEVEWNGSHQSATVKFRSTSALIDALANVRRHETVDIPIRLPIDIRNGPEIYRFPFDFCLSSTGLRNSYLFGEAFLRYPFARHLLLVLKKWGRSSGVINSIDGLLASYALTVMLAHFLVKVGVIPKLSVLRRADEPQLLPLSPEYRVLAGLDGQTVSEVGFLLAGFLEYYGHIFDYSENVVCATNTNLSKKTMRWDKMNQKATGRPPFFEFAMKDPFGLDNIARNLDANAVMFVKRAHELALQSLVSELGDPNFIVSSLIRQPPKPTWETRSLSERGIHSEFLSPDQLEARHVLSKMEFHERKRSMERLGRRAVRNTEKQRLASDVTKNILGWIKSDESN